MLKNYLKIAFRNILRNKVYSFINITGLAVGMAACIMIALYVRFQYSFDDFDQKADRIYRVNDIITLNGKTERVPLSPPSLGPFLKTQFPQIEHVVRFFAMDMITPIGNPPLKYREKVLRADQFILVDSSFFSVFSFRMIEGNPNKALVAPFSVVVTKSAARKLFGTEDPIGKSITYEDKFHFTVTGVAQDPPPNSTIQFDYLGSLNSLPALNGDPNTLESNFQSNYYTYVLLTRGARAKDIEAQLPKVLEGYWDKTMRTLFNPREYLEPLRDIYWDNDLQYDVPVKGSRSTTAAFSIIAALILLIACANFINLSTARSLTRSKEVGIRKVIGSHRKQLLAQFMIESGSISLIAIILAAVLVEVIIPQVNKVMGTALSLNEHQGLGLLLLIIAVWVLTGFLAGILPASYLSSFQPASAFKGRTGSGWKRELGGKFFILFQFSSAIALIICTIVVVRQYNLMKFRNLGFDKDNVIVLNYDQGANGSYEPFKNKLLQNPHVLDVASGDAVPGSPFAINAYYFKTNGRTESLQLSFALVDPDYIPALGMKLIAGRNFSWGDKWDTGNTFVLNETAVRKIGWTPQEAIGQPFDNRADSLKGTVVGVVADFNYRPLQYHVEPLAFIGGNNERMLLVRISPDQPGATVRFIEKTRKDIYPNSPIQLSFLDRNLDALYRSEEKMSVLFTWFSALAIVVACLGLYGLALDAAEKKTKEIGIRKVLGAPTREITFILSREFLKWVLIANVVAWPVAYYFMNNWLRGFAYRTNMTPWTFVFSGILALMTAELTVGFHAIRAATANPIESLRYE